MQEFELLEKSCHDGPVSWHDWRTWNLPFVTGNIMARWIV